MDIFNTLDIYRYLAVKTYLHGGNHQMMSSSLLDIFPLDPTEEVPAATATVTRPLPPPPPPEIPKKKMGYKRYCSLRKCFQITPSAAGILNQAIFTQIIPPSVIFLQERLYNSTSSPSSGSGSGSSGGSPVMSSMEKLFQGSFLENIPRVVKSSSIIFGKFTSHNTTMDYELIVWLRTMGFMYHLFVNHKTFITIIHGSRNRSFKQNNECTFYWSKATREIAARMVVASHHENLYVISNAFKYVDASNIGLKPVMLMKPIIGNDISLPYIHEKTYHYQHKEPGSSFDEYYFDVLLKNAWA